MTRVVGSDEIKLSLPWDDIDAGPGIAIDIGAVLFSFLVKIDFTIQ